MYRKDTQYRLYLCNTDKKAKLRERYRFEAFAENQVWPLGFGQDPDILYVQAYHDGRLAVFKMNLNQEALALELVFADERYDVDGRLIYSPKIQDIIGTTYVDDGGYTFWDPDYIALQDAIDKALLYKNNIILGLSKDENKYLLKSSSSVDAGSYYLGDKVNSTLRLIGRKYDALKSELMAEKQRFSYKARDGLAIDGFVTLPKAYKKVRL